MEKTIEKHFDECWQTELEYKGAFAGGKYQEEYIDKWASIQALVERIGEVTDIKDNKKCMELGAGEATMSILLSLQGCQCKCIDSSSNAKMLAEKVSKEVGISLDYEINNFFNTEFIEAHEGKFDFVSSSGVIEHFSREKQIEFLKINKRLSKKWVFVAIPNTDGEIFKSYISWTKKNGTFYDVYHEDITINELKERIIEAGMEPVLCDGFLFYFSKEEMYGEVNETMADLHKIMRKKIINAGGSKYADFPHMTFNYNDLEVLKSAESSFSNEERMKNGFMYYILAKV